MLPMAWRWPHSHSQMFRGVPQYRFRLTAQSWTFSSQSPKRPLPMLSGYHFTVLLFRMSWVLHVGHLMYQDSLA